MRATILVLALALSGPAAAAGAAERYPHTPIPGLVRPVVFGALDDDEAGGTIHPNCRYGAPCCCVANATDPGFCTGTNACKNSGGSCTSDSAKCPNG